MAEARTIPTLADIEGILPVAKGGTGLVALPKFIATRGGSDLTVNAGGFTDIACGTEVLDSNANYDTSAFQFTPTVAGTYRLGFALLFASGATNVRFLASIFNGGSELFRLVDEVSAGGVWQRGASVLVSANGSTDAYAVKVYQLSGGDMTLSGDPSFTYFQGHYVL